mgnify:FL=1
MIPGMCMVWARERTQPYWHHLPNAPRGYADCEALVEYYEENWGKLYDYRITAASQLCRPASVYSK